MSHCFKGLFQNTLVMSCRVWTENADYENVVFSPGSPR